MPQTVSDTDLERIVRAEHHDPFEVLGCHPVKLGRRKACAVRAFDPTAVSITVVPRDGAPRVPMDRLHEDGFFEAVFPDRKQVFDYELELRWSDGTAAVTPDPYRFLPLLGELDLQLLGEGTHYRSYEQLGAHVRTVDGITGVHFAVWAPNARRVAVTGDFNNWDGRRHPMRVVGGSGIWELFIPGLRPGERYKYELKGPSGDVFTKADPHAFFSELRPGNASVVWDLGGYAWGDDEWLAARAARDPFAAPISIYEVHLGSWMHKPEEDDRWLTYAELAEELVAYVTRMGYTHVELLPITEHPLDLSWGYQCSGYFAPTSRFGTPQEFMALVDALHRAGVGVILDWVPAHFPRDAHGLGRFDGTALYEHADPRKGEHRDWGTYVFNYGRNEVRNFLLSSALFWLREYHLDGLRVDAVASMLYLDYSREEGQWVPNEHGGRENLEAISLLRRLNELTHGDQPGTMVLAEESTAFPGVTRPVHDGGLGFTFKWNMGWMHDTLAYFAREPIHRQYHHNQLSFGLLYAFSENFVLPISHDEVVHMKGSMIAKMPGDYWQKFANLRAYYGFMWTMPGKKLLFMGQEFAQFDEWNDHLSLDWNLLEYDKHRGMQEWVRALNGLYRDHPALHQRDASWEGFQWLAVDDHQHSTLAYLRRGADPADHVVVLCNFTPVPREGYVVGVPEATTYDELLNSDAEAYGGSNVGNLGAVEARAEPHGEWPASLTVTLPPLAVVILAPRRG